MKKFLVSVAFFVLIANFAFAQKFGYIDSEFILNKMPEYAEAKQEVEGLAADWDKEVRSLFNEVEVMRSKLRAEAPALSKIMKEEREAEIDKKEQEALNRNTDLFGPEGLYWKKKDELLLPLRTKLFEAVEAVSKQQKLDFVFDKSADIGLIYTNPVHDYTEFVLEELGLGEPQN